MAWVTRRVGVVDDAVEAGRYVQGEAGFGFEIEAIHVVEHRVTVEDHAGIVRTEPDLAGREIDAGAVRLVLPVDGIAGERRRRRQR